MMKLIGETYIVPEIKDGVSESDLDTIFATSEPDTSDDDDQERMKNTFQDLPPQANMELPRPLPENLDLSQAVVFVGETRRTARVFLVNTLDGSLYHVVNFFRDRDESPTMGLNGYAAVGGKVYFIGGCYNDHDEQWSYYNALSVIKASKGLGLYDHCDDDNLLTEVSNMAMKIRAKHLQVQAFNLKTRSFDTDLSELNSPKPCPIVFVHGGKIYVHSRPSGELHIPELIRFECLDPSSNSGVTWTKLPDPIYPAYPRILNRQKGTLLSITDREDDKEEEFVEFDLKSHKWRPSTDPLCQDVTPLANEGLFDFDGCIVGNFFFFYDGLFMLKVPLICVYDLRGKGAENGPCCTIDLSEALKDYHIRKPIGRLHHLGNFRFSLVIFDSIQSLARSVAVCTLSFDLHCDVTARREATNEPKQPKIEKAVFTLGSSVCRMFQLPNALRFFFCQRMEGSESLQ